MTSRFRNSHSEIGMVLIKGVMGLQGDNETADAFAKHLQEHRTGVPVETRVDCEACRRYEAEELKQP